MIINSSKILNAARKLENVREHNIKAIAGISRIVISA